jgi:hypothetical protein
MSTFEYNPLNGELDLVNGSSGGSGGPFNTPVPLPLANRDNEGNVQIDTTAGLDYTVTEFIQGELSKLILHYQATDAGQSGHTITASIKADSVEISTADLVITDLTWKSVEAFINGSISERAIIGISFSNTDSIPAGNVNFWLAGE